MESVPGDFLEPPSQYLWSQDGLMHQRCTMLDMRTTDPMHACLGLLSLGIPDDEIGDMMLQGKTTTTDEAQPTANSPGDCDSDEAGNHN
jgi:hypothetical protein